ncbi:MAG: NADH-dependent phenylglyoxylate dehydrogenase subunit epsilon [Deferrisomatales bacterium]
MTRPLTRYVIVGAGHAALAAVRQVRFHDADGAITLVAREPGLPYSPTILPWVVSGRVPAERTPLVEPRYFEELGAELRPGQEVVGVDPGARRVTLASGETLPYDRLLLATGAAPVAPPIPGLAEVPYHRLRTLEDALALREAAGRARTALVLGGGLVGLHAAENLARAGLTVTVVEQEARLLPTYLDPEAAALVEAAFRAGGVELCLGARAVGISGADPGVTVRLETGRACAADLLLVATGVRPELGYLAGTGVATGEGIRVDGRMRTSVEGIWAAGDVAQAPGFFGPEPRLNPVLPDAVEQGRIAGMDMAGDPAAEPYLGGVGYNTFSFFDHHAFSVGLAAGPSAGEDVHRVLDPLAHEYRKLVFRGDTLVGAAAIDSALDPGLLWHLIRRRVDLGGVKAAFCESPRAVARSLAAKARR